MLSMSELMDPAHRAAVVPHARLDLSTARGTPDQGDRRPPPMLLFRKSTAPRFVA